MKGRNTFPPLQVSFSLQKEKPGALTFGELSCSYFYNLFCFFDLKNLSHWRLNQSRRFTQLLCSLWGTYHVLYCRHFLTIHFNFNLENTDTITEEALAGEIASLKPPLTLGLGNWDWSRLCHRCTQITLVPCTSLLHKGTTFFFTLCFIEKGPN